MLDLPGCISGTVVRGFRQARAVGFPTANVELKEPLDIAQGTYLGWATIDQEEKRIPALVFYGTPHAIPDVQKPRLEVHLLGETRNIYGRELNIELISFVRPNQRFDTDAALTSAITADYNKAKEFFNLKPLTSHP